MTKSMYLLLSLSLERWETLCEKEKILVTILFFYPQYCLFLVFVKPSPRQILDSSKTKEFADNNSYFHVDNTKFSREVENTVGKGEIAHYEQFLLSPQCFQGTCKADT